jgi:hypothetical protein
MQHEGEAMSAVKTIGASGQISLGKEYAGRNAVIDEVEKGVWLVKLGNFIPDSERWLHEPEVKASIDRAVAWAQSTPPRPSDAVLLGKRSSRRNRKGR